MKKYLNSLNSFSFMAYVELIGFIAGLSTTIAFIPQVVKTWKTKSTKDISLKMYILFCFGICLWALYGVLNGLISIIIANTMTIILAVMILGMKIKYG